ncbi:hypothetical protein KW842_05870 [Duganella sp. sic0402]|uniref:hypothetical protein n=1 Tax=Duganella sp. sic0402 TaxID=2854786 RepID=UPI001C492A32|nr:hypothetical protein [Duganella sp. sic0402]MBV7535290.1 hypothetical protein [Duganella sp. sic0402]
MMILRLVLSFFLSFGFVPVAKSGPAETAAAEFVQQRQLGRNLKTLAGTVAVNTQTYAILVSKLGAGSAQALVSKELDAYIGQYLGKWDGNLAQIYARHFTAEELRSLASEGRNSRFMNKLASKQEVIGAEMEGQSKPILSSYVSAALNSAFQKAPQK